MVEEERKQREAKAEERQSVGVTIRGRSGRVSRRVLPACLLYRPERKTHSLVKDD